MLHYSPIGFPVDITTRTLCPRITGMLACFVLCRPQHAISWCHDMMYNVHKPICFAL